MRHNSLTHNADAAREPHYLRWLSELRSETPQRPRARAVAAHRSRCQLPFACEHTEPEPALHCAPQTTIPI